MKTSDLMLMHGYYMALG
uniref:Uncharacterized protein n=1 Tax=Arundo donax TaxID=35708 RepID=A0A0A9BW39_ARUDO